MPNKTTDKGLTIIQESESLRLKAYYDTGNVLTIGWGHTGPDVKPGMVITEDQAKKFLQADVEEAEGFVKSYVLVPLTQNQFDALVSFVFNIGPKQFQASTLLRMLNQKDFTGAQNQFKRWNMDNGKVQGGLVTRRAKEAKLFGSP